MGSINFLEKSYEYKLIQKKIREKVSNANINKDIERLTEEVVKKYRQEIAAIKSNKLKRAVLETRIIELIDEQSIAYEGTTREELIKSILDEVFGYSILQKYIEDDTVNDIMVNDYNNIYVRRGNTDEKVNVQFPSRNAYEEFLFKVCAFCGEKLNASNPKVDGVDDNFNLRINITTTPMNTYSPCLVIRKNHKNINLDKIITSDLYPEEILKTIDLYRKAGCRVIIAGPMESGKTTWMNAYLNEIKDERIIVMEDTPELHLKNDNVIYMKTIEGKGKEEVRVTLSDLVRNFKRTNGTMPVVSEVRGEEAVELLDIFNAGFIKGCTSIHANSAEETIRQLIFQIKASGKLGTDRKELEEYLSRTIDVIIYLEKRKIVSISEVDYDYENEKIIVNDIHKFQIEKETKDKIMGQYKTCINPMSKKMIDRIRRVGLVNEIPKELMRK